MITNNTKPKLEMESPIERCELTTQQLDLLFLLSADDNVSFRYGDIDKSNTLRVHWIFLIVPVSYQDRTADVYFQATEEWEVVAWYRIYHQHGIDALLNVVFKDRLTAVPERIQNNIPITSVDIYSMLIDLARDEEIIFYYADDIDWKIALLTNDSFAYASFDTEDIELDDVPLIHSLYCNSSHEGILAWVAVKRDYPPIKPWMNYKYLTAINYLGTLKCLSQDTVAKLSQPRSIPTKDAKSNSTIFTIGTLLNDIKSFIRNLCRVKRQ